ncbi:MAG TPA: PQQ-binding-like beta-propeller repeat protein, partial [Armatimonadota bacterium]|nr:PQQ-binding-like beta-propeller repeat protein [Armatimonadota bacterium]
MEAAAQVFVSLVGQDEEGAPGRPPAGPLLVAGDLLLVATQEPGSSTQPATLHALGLSDGQPRWHKDFPHALVSGLAAAPDGLILVALSSSDLLRGEGLLLALDAAGDERYRWAPGVQRISAPAVAGDLACLTADGCTLVLLDPASGVERVRVGLEASASASAPALWVGGREGASVPTGLPMLALVPCRGPQLLAVGADGRPRWRFEAAGSPEAWLDRTPLVVGERVYAVLTSGAALALQLDDGALLWQVAVGPAGRPLSAPVSDGERLYVGARDGLYALALDEGHEVWHFPTARRVTAAPVVAGGVVYATCHDHCLYALDAASGEELWRYEVGRRIEVPPLLAACGDPPRPCVVVADHGGTLTAVARPLSAEEHETAGHWLEAAAAYAARGLARQQAEMLERQARSLEEAACGDAECAVAWEAAARAWEAEGEAERAAACQQAVERCRHQPAITLDVRHEGLVLGAWSRLQFTVRNAGYGPARNLVVHALGEQFEGQVTQTRRIVTLPAGREQAEWLDVRPRQHGDSVPLRVRVEYQDQAGEMCDCEQTIYMAVARSEAVPREGQTVNDFVGGTSYHAEVHGSGAVAQGPGAAA